MHSKGQQVLKRDGGTTIRLPHEEMNHVTGWIDGKSLRRPTFTGNRSFADSRQGRKGTRSYEGGILDENVDSW